MTLLVLLLLAQEPAQVLNAEKAWAGADVLMPLVASSDPIVRTCALRAVGRLEDPGLVPQLLALPAPPKGPSPGAVADAVAQSLKGFDPKNNPQLITSVAGWMLAVGAHSDKEISFQVVGAIGRIAWLAPEQVRTAEAILVHIVGQTAQDPKYLGVYRRALRSLESLARLNARIAALDEETVKILDRSVQKLSANDTDDAARLNALSALVAARAVDRDSESAALQDASPEIRLVAVSVLGGAGGGLDEAARLARIQDAL